MSDLRIYAALAPRVAVLSSPDVDRIIQLNDIPDLATLLRPFESSVERLSVRTSQLETRICDCFPLRFDPYSLFNLDAAHAISALSSQSQPRPSAVGRSNEELLDGVNQLIATNIKRWDGLVPRPPSSPATDEPSNEAEEGGALEETLRNLQQTPLEESTPWFAAVQQLVFGQRSIAKHESFGHPVAVLLAVSSASPDPMNDFARLYETSSQPQPFPAHPYINPDTLKYYVLIHDVRTSGTDLSGSKEILEQIKKTYGLHCCLLAINSKDEGAGGERGLASLWKDYLPISPASPTSPNPDSEAALEGVAQYLGEEDVKRIKNFIRELTAQSIVPFMERYVQHMGEYLANSRKGLSNRLFGASRKFFSSSSTDKTAGLATSGGYDAQLEFYPYSSIEAQTRRLADFAFTIRDYKLAAAMYDLGRRDFSNDKAHKHIAGATEMFGLSHLMQMFASRAGVVDVDSYLAQACQEYSLRSSTTPAVGVEESYGLRATLLYYEAYRMLNYLKPVPAGLLRMALRSEEVLAPLLLEQAALTYLQQRPAALRKYALHLVGAAHRFQACGQKLLSLRCYAQAALVYRGKGWGLVENHIERELGTQAYNEGNSDVAVEHLIRLIRPNGGSKEEQEAVLGDVVNAYKYATAGGEMELKWEMFDTNTARLSFGGEGGYEGVWEGLEQQLIDTGLGERVGANGERRRRKRPVGKSSGQGGEVALGHTFWLDVVVRNPFAVELAVDNIKPILQLNGAPLSAEHYETDTFPLLILTPLEQRPIRLSLRINTEAKQVRLANLNFRLAETILLTQKLNKKGKRLNSTKDQRTTVSYASDTSLAVTVHSARPTLTARVADVPEELFLGEERRVKVVIKNEGRMAVDDVRALCSASSMASFAAAAAEGRREDGGRVMMPNGLNAAGPEFVLDSDGTTQLAPGEEKELELVVRATTPGDLTLSWLLAFSPVGKEETYLSRLSFSTRVTPAIEVRVETVPRESKAPEHDMVVEVTNRLKKQQVRLDAFSLVSPRFGFAGAPEQEGVVIAGNQTWRGRFVITPLSAGTGVEEGQKHTETKLQDLLLSRDVKRAPVGDISLHLSSTNFGKNKSRPQQLAPSLYGESRKLWRKATLASTFPTIPSRQRESIFTLYSRFEVDLSVHFSLEDRKGSVTVFGLQPGPSRSIIRAITHPTLDAASGADKGKIRSLYAQTVREKATLLANILSSPLALETNPVVVHHNTSREEGKEGEKEKFIVRNFSDAYQARVVLQLQGAWEGRKTLRCDKVGPGEGREVEALRKVMGGREGGRRQFNFVVDVETSLPTAEADGERVVVGRYSSKQY